MSSPRDYIMDFTLPDTEVPTTPGPSGLDSTMPPPPPPPPDAPRRRGRSVVWDHFIEEPGSEKKAKCNYCGVFIKFKDGTSAMKTHLTRCKENPSREGSKRQKTSSSSQGQQGSSVVTSPQLWFDQEACRLELVKMFVSAELPFRFVENEAFRSFVYVLQPRFNLPSRTTLRRAIWSLYEDERARLKKFLFKHCGRVCLTTDTWTSVQNLHYMTLTTHFVDNNWNLHKKILNFCQITSSTGEDMAKNVEDCLTEWNLNRVFSITVDNASSNNVGIQYLKKILASWNGLALKGEYIHMRCCAHILSLIVKEGLKDIDESILKIRCAVKYVRASPSRLNKFKKCVERQKISYKGLICLDVDTRWNSTYLMLKAALRYRKAFDLLMENKKYVSEIRKYGASGAPVEKDWDFASSTLVFLKMFYDATMRISGSTYVTSNIYMKEVFNIGRKIQKHCESDDKSIKSMATKMKEKYDKYWGDPKGINMLLLIVVVLDPRSKLGYVHFFLEALFDSDKAAELKLKLTSSMKSLYEHYQGIEEGSEINSQLEERQGDEDDDDDIHGMNFYLQTTGCESVSKSELDKYLAEEREPFKHVGNNLVEFDILNWWKVNSSKFPILASMAREVLAIPVSTVASESAFSTGGRVLGPYCSNLTPKIVEGLICTQDWLKGTPFSSLFDEDLEELEKFEQEIIPPTEGASSSAINLDD